MLETGLGNDMNSWPKSFIKKINHYATVLVYNRIGYKGSVDESTKRNKGMIKASQVAENLHDLLAKLDIRQPVILCAHSLGGLYVHYFARKYPEQVVAVVLMDASSPDDTKNSPFTTSAKLTPGTIGSREDEGMYPSMLQIRKLPPFPQVPLFIIVANNHYPDAKHPDLEKRWLALQERSLRLSNESELIIADGSGHYVFRDQPNVVITAVVKSIEKSEGVANKL